MGCCVKLHIRISFPIAEAEHKRREAERKAEAAKRAAQQAEAQRRQEMEKREAERKAAQKAREEERRIAAEEKHAETLRRREELHQQKMRHLAELQASQDALRAAVPAEQPKPPKKGKPARAKFPQSIQSTETAPRLLSIITIYGIGIP